MHPLFALLLLSTPTIIVQNPSGQSVEVAAQRLVVGWEANTLFTASPNETTLFFGSGGERITTIELPTGVDLHQERERLSALEGVAWVEYDNLNRLHALPNDPTWGDQWTLQVMNMETAWDIETGDSSIVVAVLDSGFDLTNTGIGYAAWDPATELIDFGNNDGDPTWTTASLCNPGAFHGTATAGLIASKGNDGLGITGVGWGLNVLPVKVMRDSDCGIWDSDWTAALNWIVDNRPDVRVVNISFGSEGTGSLQSAAIEKAWNGGVLVVASAGNCGDPATWQDNGCTTLNPLFFPASLDHVIAVASTDEDDGRSLFSEHGNWIDLSAPGGFSSPIGKPMPVCGLSPGAPGWGPIATDITGSDGYNTGGSGPGSLSQACDPSGGRYYSFFGTSASAPYLSGLAALVLSKTPSLTNQEVWDRLLGTARIPAGWNSSEMGVGVADGALALGALSSTLGAPLSAVSSATVDIGEIDVPVMRLHFSVPAGQSGSLRLDTLALTGMGTGNEQTQILAVEIWEDANTDGIPDGASFGSGTFDADEGTVTLSLVGNPPTLGGSSTEYLITYDLADSALFSVVPWFLPLLMMLFGPDKKRWALVVLFALLVACGGGSSPPAPSWTFGLSVSSATTDSGSPSILSITAPSSQTLTVK